MKYLLLPALSCLACASLATASDQLKANFDDKTLTSLQMGDLEILAPNSAPALVTTVVGGKAAAIPGQPGMEGKTQTIDYGTALATIQYKNEKNTLGFDVTIKNTGSEPLAQAMFSPFSIKFPNRPSGGGWFWGHTSKAEADGAPGVVHADFGTGQVVLSLDAGDASNVLPVVELTGVEVGKNQSLARFSAKFDPPLAPGAEWKFSGTLVSSPSGIPPWEVAKETFNTFKKEFPFKLDWPDRRPIGAVFLAREAQNWPTNPRGWFNEPTLDITTPEGREKFRERLMTSADTTIDQMQKVGAQGVLVWDIEGAEMNHPVTYLGDPRVLPKHAPEMDEFADEYFKKFTDAGFKVGICIRPSRIVTRPNGKPAHQQSDDAIADMSDKIAYAKKRWGATIFYMDTNYTWKISEKPLSEDITRGMWGQEGRRISSPDIVKLAEQHPDCLIFPEFGRPGYYSVAGVYGEVFTNSENIGTRDELRAIYPDAMTVYKLGDTDVPTVYEKLLNSALAGDIYLFRGWFGDHLNPLLGHVKREVDYIKATEGKTPPKDLLATMKTGTPELKYAALKSTEKPTPQQTEWLLEAMPTESDWVLQRQMIRLLGNSGDARAVEVLVEIAQDKDSLQYAAASDALVLHGPAGIEALVGLAKLNQPRVPDAALRALANSSDPAAQPFLIEVARSETPPRQALAARALGKRPSPETIAALTSLLSSENIAVVAAACTALGETGDKSVIKPLVDRMVEAVQKSQHDVRGAAGMALEKLTGLEYGYQEKAWQKALDEKQI